MKVGVLGSGIVGETLSNGLLKHGYEVVRGSRDPDKLKEWQESAGPSASTGTFSEVAESSEILFLAIKGNAAEEALELCEAEISNKIVVDATNPISDEPPVNGVINYFTGAGESLMENLQTRFQNAKFVKAFSCVGSAHMVNPDFGGVKPSMFICGNDSQAKSQVSEILDQFGWEVEDMGEVEAARAIEPLAMLWCIPGFKTNQWNHAFKLLKK